MYVCACGAVIGSCVVGVCVCERQSGVRSLDPPSLRPCCCRPLVLASLSAGAPYRRHHGIRAVALLRWPCHHGRCAGDAACSWQRRLDSWHRAAAASSAVACQRQPARCRSIHPRPAKGSGHAATTDSHSCYAGHAVRVVSKPALLRLLSHCCAMGGWSLRVRRQSARRPGKHAVSTRST